MNTYKIMKQKLDEAKFSYDADCLYHLALIADLDEFCTSEEIERVIEDILKRSGDMEEFIFNFEDRFFYLFNDKEEEW